MSSDSIQIGSSEYRKFADGGIFASFSDFREKHPGILEKYYGTLKDQDEKDALPSDVYKRKPSFSGYAHWQKTPDEHEGAILYFPRGVKCRQTLSFRIPATQRMLVILEENSYARFLIDFAPEEDIARLSEIFLREGASLEISELWSDGRFSLENEVFVRQAENSRFTNLSVVCGGKAYNRHKVIIDGKHTESHLYGTALLNGTDRLKNHTVVAHDRPECESFEQYKTVAGGNAFSEFFGRIYVAPDAQQIAAYQQNNNILLSDSAEVRTKPQLEIYADDVKCSHGATIGQLDDEAMFYMRQRGISPANARKLQIRGFVSDMVDKASDPEIREIILNRLEKSLNLL